MDWSMSTVGRRSEALQTTWTQSLATPLITVWLWVWYVTSLSDFFISKMGEQLHEPSWATVRIKWVNLYEVFRLVSLKLQEFSECFYLHLYSQPSPPCIVWFGISRLLAFLQHSALSMLFSLLRMQHLVHIRNPCSPFKHQLKHYSL